MESAENSSQRKEILSNSQIQVYPASDFLCLIMVICSLPFSLITCLIIYDKLDVTHHTSSKCWLVIKYQSQSLVQATERAYHHIQSGFQKSCIYKSICNYFPCFRGSCKANIALILVTQRLKYLEESPYSMNSKSSKPQKVARPRRVRRVLLANFQEEREG